MARSRQLVTIGALTLLLVAVGHAFSTGSQSARIHPAVVRANTDEATFSVPDVQKTSACVSASSGSRLFSQSSEESPQDEDDAGVVGESGGLKRRRWGIKGLVRPLSSLALMTLSWRGVCSVEPAQASAPVVLRPAYEQVDPLEQAMTDARKKRFQEATQEKAKMSKEWMQLADREGPAAAAKAEAAYNTLQAQQMEAKAQALAELKRSLLEDQGMCHLVDPEGARLVFLEEEGLNLNFVAGTEQARDAMDRRANPEAFDKLRALHRSIVKSIVQDVQNRGGEPLEYFKDEDNKEMTQRIYQLNAREATLLSRRYAANMETYGSTKQISPEQMEERKALKAAAEQKASASSSSSSSSSSDKAQLKEAKQKQKAERKAATKQLKEEKRMTAQKQKEEKQAARALLKKEKAGAKAAVVAATAAAGTAALAGSAAASTVATDLASSALSPATPSTSTTVISEQVKGDDFRATEDYEDDGMSLSKAISDTKSGMNTKAKRSSSSSISSSGRSVPIVPALIVAGGGAFAFKTYRDKSAQDEEERQRQFKLIMGQDDDDDEEEDDEEDDMSDDFMDSSQDKPVVTKKKSAASILPADVVVPKKKKRMGIASVFSKNKNSRETNLDNLVDSSAAQLPEFSALLAKILTFGAPGRFPHVQSLSGGMPFDEFDLEKAKELLTKAKEAAGLTDETAAEAFACVVNCMIIDIIDLASSTLKGKKEKMTVDALTVVMDFMDHAASLFDSLAQGVTIKPVTYGGSLGKGKLEQMYGIFAAAAGMDMEGSGQERVDTLQVVLNIADKKAEGIVQNQMMKKLMQMMKDGEMPEGMEDMAEMMKGMEGGMPGGMPGMPGMPGGMPGAEGDMNPEEVKNMLLMMKEAIDSGTMPKEELKAVRAQFKEAYGQSIDDLIKDASEQKGEMSKEEAELLDLMKSVLSD
eukprot:scaffold14325_cov37-Attheya_sp.AAC.1